jgi:hypothetical protein
MTLIAGDAFGARPGDTSEKHVPAELWIGRKNPGESRGMTRFFKD